MLRAVGVLAGTTILGFVALRLIGMLLLPLLGIVFGFVMFVLKLLLIAGIVVLAYRLFFRDDKRGSEAS